MKHSRIFLGIMVLALLLAPLASADSDKPTIAVVTYGPSAIFAGVQKGFLDVLEAYELLSPEERAAVDASEDIEGENMNVLFRSAGFNLATGNLMIQDVIDRGADAIVAFSTPLAQIALANTYGMDDPPQIIFAIVATPYVAGLADASCVKPGHVAGTIAHMPYEGLMEVLRVFDPDIETIGTISNPSEPNSNVGSDRISEISAEYGIMTLTQGAASVDNVRLAAEGLISKGVDAILVPPGQISEGALGVIVDVATANGIPVMAPLTSAAYGGAIIGAGFNGMYREGVITGRMLVGHLSGEADLSRTSINLTPGITVAVNLDMAAELDIEINADIMDMADFTIQDGMSTEAMMSGMEGSHELPEMTMEERHEADAAFLAGLYCSDEMIAEQMAELGIDMDM